MREAIRINLIEMAMTVVATVAILAAVGLILFVAFNYFDGWHILAAIAVQIALLVFAYHFYRWFRYPGLFQSKSSGQLLFEVFFSILLIYAIPLIALLVKIHAARFLQLEKAGSKLGLEFKFKMREEVRLSPDAPSHARELGRIARVRVIAENDISPTPLRTGEVLYGVRFAEEIVDIPERYVLRRA